jgi:hypothetical protein
MGHSLLLNGLSQIFTHLLTQLPTQSCSCVLFFQLLNYYLRSIRFFFLDETRGLNSGLHTCKAGTLPLEPHLQSMLLWLFWRQGLMNYLPGLAWNHDPPNLTSQAARITYVNHPVPDSDLFYGTHIFKFCFLPSLFTPMFCLRS